MESLAEEWRVIPGYPNYEASNHGRVRSLDRIIRRMGPHGEMGEFRWKGRIMKLIPHRGWLVVKLGGARLNTWGVHQVVAWAFHGPCQDGLVVDHVNTIKTDNRPSNLEYVTSTENALRQYRTGLLSNRGETNGNAKFTRDQIKAIRESNLPLDEIAAGFGTSVGYVKNLRNKRVRLWAEAQVA